MNCAEAKDIRGMVTAAANAPVQAEVMKLVDCAVAKFSPAVRAVVFYGSCRRDTTVSGLVDLYVIIDSYASLPAKDRWLARLIPPNVYYLEIPGETSKLRCKCTVISSNDFTRGACRWFHPYIWGRFAQPVTIAYSASDDDKLAAITALTGALSRLIKATLPLMPDQFTAKQLWCRGLARSFGTELRAESAQRARHIYISDRAYYNHASALLLRPASANGQLINPTSPATRRLGAFAWQLRGITGKTFSVIRVLKGALTFVNGLDYVVWKLERHSGQPITVPERVRRHPAIFLLPFFVDLYRRGIFH